MKLKTSLIDRDRKHSENIMTLIKGFFFSTLRFPFTFEIHSGFNYCLMFCWIKGMQSTEKNINSRNRLSSLESVSH